MCKIYTWCHTYWQFWTILPITNVKESSNVSQKWNKVLLLVNRLKRWKFGYQVHQISFVSRPQGMSGTPSFSAYLQQWAKLVTLSHEIPNICSLVDKVAPLFVKWFYKAKRLRMEKINIIIESLWNNYYYILH